MIEILKHQYNASLSMLRDCIGKTEDKIWHDPSHTDPAWQLAYHAIFYANIYAAPAQESIVPWPQEIENYGSLKHDPNSPKAPIVIVFSQNEIIEFLDHVAAQIPQYLENFQPDADCWPFWYSVNQLEFHMYNLRHIQHHTGQLIERQSATNRISVAWK